MVVTLKFWQNSSCRAKLFATKDAVLIEASPFDDFWGVGREGAGKNVLGKLLMEIRDTLRHSRKFAGEYRAIPTTNIDDAPDVVRADVNI